MGKYRNLSKVEHLKADLRQNISNKLGKMRARARKAPPEQREDINLGIRILRCINDLLALIYKPGIYCG